MDDDRARLGTDRGVAVLRHWGLWATVWRFLWAVVVVWFLVPQSGLAGKLDDAFQDAGGECEARQPDNDRRDDHDHHDHHDHDHDRDRDDYDHDHDDYDADDDSATGSLLAAVLVDSGGTRFRLTGRYGYDWAPVHSGDAEVWLLLGQVFGFRLEMNNLIEQVTPRDARHVLLGSAHLMVGYENEKYGAFLSGGYIGMYHPAGDIQGVTMAAVGRVKVLKPLVFGVGVEAGMLGEAWFDRVRATVGVSFLVFELDVGYHFMNIGEAIFHGPTVGLNLDFSTSPGVNAGAGSSD